MLEACEILPAEYDYSSVRDELYKIWEFLWQKFNCNDTALPDILVEHSEFIRIRISDILFCQEVYYKNKLRSDEEALQNIGRDTPIIGFRIRGTEKILLYEGHHRILRKMFKGEKFVDMYVYENVPYGFFDVMDLENKSQESDKDKK